ncbi:MAG: cytochrome c oxidase assembly protein [Oryzihumus sp.]
MLPPPTASSWLTAWTADPVGIALGVLLLAGYAVCLVRLHRTGRAWSGWRALAFAVLGVGTLVYATCGVLAVYRGTLFWMAAAQATVLSAVTPLGLALGDPVTVSANALGDRGSGRLLGVLRGRVARVLMFPLVSSAVAVGALVAVFFTPWLADSVASAGVREVLYLVLLGTGALFVLPLLGEEMLPAWCTHPVRALFAFVDGLADAVPGILVMTAPTLLAAGVPGYTDRTWGPDPAWDQKLGGGAMLGIAESVGLPFLFAVLIGWVRADAAEARAVDAELDARERAPQQVQAAEGVAEEGAAPSEPARERPWWETDPRFRDQYR